MKALIEFDYEHAIEKSHTAYNSCKRVIIYSERVNCSENGIVFKDEAGKINSLEISLLCILSDIDCRLTGKMQYGAMCDFCFQTNDSVSFLTKVNKWISVQKSHKIEIIEKNGWDFFDAKVKPNHIFWHQIIDRKLIGTLLEKGSNPEKEHLLDHVFMGDEEELKKLRDQLANDGFVFMSLNNKILQMQRSSILDSHQISNLTQRLTSYTSSLGIKYDGWGSKIEK